MPPSDETGPGDIHRRLNELESDHKDLARQHATDMRDIHQQLIDAKHRGDETYLRKDVFAEARKADAGVVANIVESVKGLKGRLDTDEAFRRQMQLGLGVAVLGAVTSIAIALVSLLAR